jgi:hypothetical protein
MVLQAGRHAFSVALMSTKKRVERPKPGQMTITQGKALRRLQAMIEGRDMAGTGNRVIENRRQHAAAIWLARNLSKRALDGLPREREGGAVGNRPARNVPQQPICHWWLGVHETEQEKVVRYLMPNAGECIAMLRELAKRVGSWRTTAIMLGMRRQDVRKVLGRNCNLQPTRRRLIWVMWALWCCPSKLRTGWDVLTWGRYAKESAEWRVARASAGLPTAKDALEADGKGIDSDGGME